MPTWTFEPGHCAAMFCARHMMVACVRGHIKDVHGTLEFDPDDLSKGGVEAVLDARKLWSGEEARDAHLKSADFLDVENHPEIRFVGTTARITGPNDFEVGGELTLRGVTRPVTLEARYLGMWPTPWWEDGVDKGPMLRVGFEAKGCINRHDFGVSWNSSLDKGGLVVGDEIEITIDIEAYRKA